MSNKVTVKFGDVGLHGITALSPEVACREVK